MLCTDSNDVDKVTLVKQSDIWSTRVNEHSNSNSAIHEHVSFCAVCQAGFSVECFQHIDSGSNDIKVSMKGLLQNKYS